MKVLLVGVVTVIAALCMAVAVRGASVERDKRTLLLGSFLKGYWFRDFLGKQLRNGTTTTEAPPPPEPSSEAPPPEPPQKAPSQPQTHPYFQQGPGQGPPNFFNPYLNYNDIRLNSLGAQDGQPGQGGDGGQEGQDNQNGPSEGDPPAPPPQEDGQPGPAQFQFQPQPQEERDQPQRQFPSSPAQRPQFPFQQNFAFGGNFGAPQFAPSNLGLGFGGGFYY